jgi:hypothetical protein
MNLPTAQLRVLQCGACETLKAGVHASALGLFVVMGLYNAAAWLSRREQHLAVNALMYAALTAWERKHVARHMAVRRSVEPAVGEMSAPRRMGSLAA